MRDPEKIKAAQARYRQKKRKELAEKAKIIRLQKKLERARERQTINAIIEKAEEKKVPSWLHKMINDYTLENPEDEPPQTYFELENECDKLLIQIVDLRTEIKNLKKENSKLTEENIILKSFSKISPQEHNIENWNKSIYSYKVSYG